MSLPQATLTSKFLVSVIISQSIIVSTGSKAFNTSLITSPLQLSVWNAIYVVILNHKNIVTIMFSVF